MNDLNKYFDLLESKKLNAMTSEEINELEKELGDINEFLNLDSKIVDCLNNDEDQPSSKVKHNLDSAFENKHGAKHSGIIPIGAFEKSSPWKMMATAASISLILFLSVQMGFKNQNSFQDSSPYLADSVEDNSVIDSSFIFVDSTFIVD